MIRWVDRHGRMVPVVPTARGREHAQGMAVVDPDDDSIQRYVVWHYCYDADRNERRNVVVAAFDEEQEFLAEITRRAARLKEL
jgi:hypothetical protein